MKALQKTAPSFGVEFREVPRPVPGPGEALIEITAAGVCGTDVHIFEWSGGYDFMASLLPLTLGHEFAGRVIDVAGDANGLAPGALVAVIPSTPCGSCAHCLSGAAESCERRSAKGTSADGGFAPWITAPVVNCLEAPNGVDDELAALAEPLTVAQEAVLKGGVTRGNRVLVIGPGTIGQAIALYARMAEAAEVVVVGKNDPLRFETLRALGLRDLIDIGDGDLQTALAYRFADQKFDIIFEATGVPEVVQEGLAFLRKEGVLIVAGIHPRRAVLDLTRLVRERHQIRGTQRAPRHVWPRVLDSLVTEGERIRHMITHRMSLDHGVEALELARTRRASKIILSPGVRKRRS